MIKNYFFKLCFVFMSGVVLFSCKKPNKLGQSEAKQLYFSDTFKVSLGALPATASELQKIGYVEDLDSSLIAPLRVQATSHFITNLPAIGNQNSYLDANQKIARYESCVGWVLSYMLSYQYTRIEGRTFEASPAYIWNTLNQGKNVGITLPSALDQLMDEGCSGTSFMPAYSQLHIQPSPEAVVDAAKHKIANYYRFKSVDIALMKSLLNKNFPLPFGVTLDEGFLTYDRPGTTNYITVSSIATFIGPQYIYKKQSGSQIGGHAMLVVGYDDAYNAFRVMNSWGDKFGSAGFIWIDYEVFQKMVVNSPEPNLFFAIPREVYLNKIKSVKATTVIADGAVINEAGEKNTERGFCLSTFSRIPTIQDISEKDANGSIAGDYSITVSGLIPETKYWIRPYAKKNSGKYIYGNLDSFTTNKLLLREGSGTNAPIAPIAQTFGKGSGRIFSFSNFDLSPETGIDYSKVTTANISNNLVTISQTNTTSDFNLTLRSNQAGTLLTEFDILYKGKKVNTINATVNDIDSTNYYKSIIPGEWSNYWEYIFPGTSQFSFYEEDFITLFAGGTGIWHSSRYYTGLVQTNSSSLTWNVYRSGNNYIMSLGAQSGRITPTSMQFVSNPAPFRMLTSKK